MLEHHLQKSIVYALALTDSLRFSELKPNGIENKLFDYHLKKVLASGLITKLEDGSYGLTSLGRRVGKDALKKSSQLIDRAYSVLFLAVRRNDGAWLLCKRRSHPLLDRIGFLHAQPDLMQHSEPLACNELEAKTGLTGSFAVRGSGYLRVFENEQLESFTHFTLLVCNDAHGDLQQLDPLAEYYWQNQPDFKHPLVLPHIVELVGLLDEPGLFYFERDYSEASDRAIS